MLQSTTHFDLTRVSGHSIYLIESNLLLTFDNCELAEDTLKGYQSTGHSAIRLYRKES